MPVDPNLLKAAAAGDPDGMYLLGVSYYEGIGVRSLFPQAAKWLNAAREAGSPKANTPETREMLAVIEGYLNTNGKKPTHGIQS